MDILVFKETNMNWSRLQTGCRVSVQLILVISLLTVTFFQFLKYKKEIANISISYNNGEQDLELPSITLCPEIWENKQENMTFEEYMMENVLKVSDFFEDASQSTYLLVKYIF